MKEATAIAATIREAIPTIRPGCLRFWGDWFGRPADNQHELVSTGVVDEALVLVFDCGETLQVWEPSGLTIEDGALYIVDASAIRWEWTSYGEPVEATPRDRIDYKKQNGCYIHTHKTGFCTGTIGDHPAVSLI